VVDASIHSVKFIIQLEDKAAQLLVLSSNECHDLVDLVQFFGFALEPLDVLLFPLAKGSLCSTVLLSSSDRHFLGEFCSIGRSA
jgi:hypothetical protein